MNANGDLNGARSYCGIIGVSPWAARVRADIRRLARFPSTVLITGPTGTGKELIARAIHNLSVRSAGPFVPVDCAAVPGSLFSSHLFGHVAGAYTGANHAELGCFRAAHGGTVFLDEIGELEFGLQAKLLRVLQERMVVPLGAHKEISIDVRVISASNRDLRQAIGARQFRGDLYYRLNVATVCTIPLKDRPEDIDVLVPHFLVQLAARHRLPLKRVSPAALEWMRLYEWPGNVRQLQNTLEFAVLLTEDDVIGPDLISSAETSAVRLVSEPNDKVAERPGGDGAVWPTMADAEREHLRRTLAFTNYNQSAAAELLKISRQQVARKLRKYGLSK
jgi:transcriptional regulator with PAS, ATPase and Fis domain